MLGCSWCVACYLLVAVIAYKIFSWVYVTFVAQGSLKKYLKAGNWAVVTGASDGIGKAFALELARAGFNVALISRTKSKLDEVAEECKKLAPKVETKAIAFDFSAASAADYLKLSKELESISIGILVNNVGINYDHPQFYEDSDIAEDLRILKVNCESQLQLTKMALKQMKPKRCGAIVNLSSFSAAAEAGLLSTYAATKAFNKTFSLAIATEVLGTNIDVLALTPNMVISNMSKTKRETFLIVSAKSMVRQSLNKLGVTVLNAGHWHHAVVELFFSALPRSIRQKQVRSSLLALKRKAEKKASSEKKD